TRGARGSEEPAEGGQPWKPGQERKGGGATGVDRRKDQGGTGSRPRPETGESQYAQKTGRYGI
uniref:Uncharacterized protein n=1 Tax=Romanomermis culicivorax TaxID=13658 RepID=A0A915IFC1_ROMCU